MRDDTERSCFTCVLIAVCVGYFSIAVIKHHDQGRLQKEDFIWSYGSRGIRIYHGQKHQAQQHEQKLRTFELESVSKESKLTIG